MDVLSVHSRRLLAPGANPFVLKPEGANAFAFKFDAPASGVVPPRPRAKLWELNNSVHCSIIGTCLTPAELRRVMGRVAQADVAHLTDHDLHAQAVGLCSQHDACAKLLQKALDRRHEALIKQFAQVAGEAAVMAKWREARAAGAIPGAYWAALTHPDVGHEGLRCIFGDVHMLSHLIGAANRADIQRLTALETENAALSAKVGRQQARLQDAITARDAARRQLADLPLDAALPMAESGGAVAALRVAVADLQARLAGEIGRRERLERRAAALSEAGQASERRMRVAEAESAALQRELTVLDHDNAGLARIALPAERVLYVGGRPGCTERIRGMLESSGGALLCHDGGRHDHPSLLPGLIGRADWVAFPVDCVSHDAALTVKRLCRSLGKRWSALRSSGVASFLAALPGSAEHGACCAHHAILPVAVASDGCGARLVKGTGC